MAIYYISPSGTSGGDGTQDDPWDFATAFAAATGGDTVMFMDGVYELASSGANYLINKSGSAGNHIILKAQNKWAAKLDGNATAGATGHYAFSINEGDSWIKFDGLEIYNLGDCGIHIADYYSHDIWVTNCKIRNICNYAATDNGWGAVLNNPSSKPYNILIENCWFQDNGDPTGNWRSHYFYMKGTNITIRNNVFCAINQPRGGTFMSFSYTPTGLVVVNNTIYEGITPSHANVDAAIYWEDNGGVYPTGVELSNNIYYGPGTYSVNFINFWNDTGISRNANSNIRNNLTYNLDSFYIYSNPLPTNLGIANNITGDPKFVSTSTPDFHLQSDSPAINAAYTTGLPAVDYDGVTRPQSDNGDIGAYEYVGETGLIYSRGDYVSLPSDDADLTTNYTTQDISDVATDDAVMVGQSANSKNAIHQFKKEIIGVGGIIDIVAQVTIPCSTSTAYLQIFNRSGTPAWDTIDSDNATGANTDFTLSATVADLTDYKDENNIVVCRVYQEMQ